MLEIIIEVSCTNWTIKDWERKNLSFIYQNTTSTAKYIIQKHKDDITTCLLYSRKQIWCIFILNIRLFSKLPITNKQIFFSSSNVNIFNLDLSNKYFKQRFQFKGSHSHAWFILDVSKQKEIIIMPEQILLTIVRYKTHYNKTRTENWNNNKHTTGSVISWFILFFEKTKTWKATCMSFFFIHFYLRKILNVVFSICTSYKSIKIYK
jgi:hypothetical protein